MMMWLSDQFKIGFLLVSWTGCLMTMFTSHSFLRENGDLNRVNIPVQRFCLASRQAAAQACSNNGDVLMDQKGISLGLRGAEDSTTMSPLCIQRKSEANKCEFVIQRAERWINLGGCSSAIQTQSICEAEWCRGGNAKECHDECAVVRNKLQGCIQRVVTDQWRRSVLPQPSDALTTTVT